MKNLPVDFEVVSVRPGHTYELFAEEPNSGQWWAVRAVPVLFPDDGFAPTTPDGERVEQLCIIAAERSKTTGQWMWCHLSPIAKRMFGDLIMEQFHRKAWWYVRERLTTVADAMAAKEEKSKCECFPGAAMAAEKDGA